MKKIVSSRSNTEYGYFVALSNINFQSYYAYTDVEDLEVDDGDEFKINSLITIQCDKLWEVSVRIFYK